MLHALHVALLLVPSLIEPLHQIWEVLKTPAADRDILMVLPVKSAQFEAIRLLEVEYIGKFEGTPKYDGMLAIESVVSTEMRAL